MAKKRKKLPSRHEQVRKILNEAQGDTIPDYQGYRAFWMLPVQELLEVEIYGQRMIAEAGHEGGMSGDGSCCQPKTSCCSEDEPAQSSSASDSCCQSDKNASEIKPQTSSDGDLSPVSESPSVSDPEMKNCWPHGGGGGGHHGAGEKRSDRSGLIIGLKGEAPFDGSIFPKLLWHAEKNVSEADIAFIAAWIDDGCPADDTKDLTKLASVKASELLSLARGDSPHKASSLPTNALRKEVSGLRVRKEVNSCTEKELGRLRSAITCMRSYNEYWQDERSYAFWARIHTSSCQHGWEQFLPWHRAYLYFFEQMLQDFDDRITLPYWDWPAYSICNQKVVKEYDTGIIPDPYRCWVDDEGLRRLQNAKGPDGTPLYSSEEMDCLREVKDEHFNSGLRFLSRVGIPFEVAQSSPSDLPKQTLKVSTIYKELQRINPLWYANRWPTVSAHYPVAEDIKTILAVMPYAAFGSGPSNDHFFGALEEVHNGMHNFAGGFNKNFPKNGAFPQNPDNPQYGYMTDNRTAAFDPIFWAHHSNVDRLWAKWQELHPGDGPEDMDGVLPPWSFSVRNTMSIKKFGYEYVKDAYHFPTANHVGMLRFNSEAPGISGHVLNTHQKADIRLHKVQRGDKPNAHIRVFLNAPEANADTPTVGNDHFVGQISTFNGSCYGGPAHCALPLPKTRSFDLRPLHHHEPRNYRINATDAVARMIAKDESDISVHLVVTGIDGKPIDNALFFDGVSLNFLD